ncbi:DUF7312 domain-containing protein [Haloarcula onubensis]|uniref:DUF7312 domain-containing protein n=1 Tax=Haloarcula onubensis TaxID=2950539 RepID=A0ABU2FK13_9EURY|nr:hypothetical protein [Halomicroarcula sp. S3CR25-11]MDS0281090.1 hypothetical protein [Halomicroarcula sp. S3CR25-11]
MSADGSDEGDEFVAEYENATTADIIEEAEPSAATDETDDEGAVAGSFAPDVAVTPQAPTPENTLFVALGICLTILALADTVVGLSLVLVAAVLVAVALTTAVCYGVLVRTTPET